MPEAKQIEEDVVEVELEDETENTEETTSEEIISFLLLSHHIFQIVPKVI